MINVKVETDLNDGEIFYVATIICPWCGTGFEAIKNSLSNSDDTGYDIFSQTMTNNWAHSSFVSHIKRCYHSVDHADNSKLFVLNGFVNTAKQNIGRKKQGYRHGDTMKMFAAYMKMLSGPLAYETLHANLPYSLPSTSKVDKFMSEKGPHIIEGVLRTKEVKEYLSDRKLPLKVWISEDATRITPKVCYDPKTNQLVGFTLPLNENGMPIPNTFMARNAREIESHFLNDRSTVSSSAYAIMANPLSEHASPFCLTLFGTDNKFNSKNVLNRWSFMKTQLREEGVSVYGNSSDGDTKCLKAMKIASRIGQETDDFDCEWYSSGPIKFVASNNETEAMAKSIYTSIYMQDGWHVATKFRNPFLKPSKVYPLGKKVISNGHLKYLIQNIQKDKHSLNYTDIQPKDRQNYPSAEKISRLNTQICLKEFVPGSESTVMYLKIMNYATTPLIDPEMSVEERISKIWYSVFALRIWRSWLLKTDGFSLKSNFISSNLYTCVELFLPLILSSQPCESTFRQFRSMSPTFSTVVVLPIYDMLFKIKKLQLQGDIVLACSGLVSFPRIENRQSRANIPSQLPKDDIIIKVICNARTEAIKDMKVLGIDTNKANTKCQVPSVYEDESEDDNACEDESGDEDLIGTETDLDYEYDCDNSGNDLILKIFH